MKRRNYETIICLEACLPEERFVRKWNHATKYKRDLTKDEAYKILNKEFVKAAMEYGYSKERAIYFYERAYITNIYHLEI